jgi:hypothetical protein
MMYSASAVRGEQASQKPEPADDRALIGVLGKVAWVDRRLVVRVGRADKHVAARQRPHLPRPAGNARPIVELANEARFVARRREDALHIRCRRYGQDLDGSRTKRGAEGHHALVLHEIANDLIGEAKPANTLVEGFEVADVARHAR